MTRFDAIVIGGSVNALAAAAYLAKAGRHVLVLDEAGNPGGGDGFAPGFTAGPVAGPGWISNEVRRDLDLERYGLELLAPESSLASMAPDGDPLVFRRDRRQTIEAIRSRSPRDAERWPAFADRMSKLTRFLGFLYHRPPPNLKGAGVADWLDLATVGRRARALGKSDLIEFLRVLPMPIADVVEDTFHDTRVKACIAASAVAGIQQGPRSGGTTFAWLHQQAGAEGGAIGMRQRVRGGSAALVGAVAAAARSVGAEVRSNAPVAAIRIAGGRATGVVLENGDEIETACVVSSAGIRRTLLDLVGAATLDPELVRAIRNIRYRGVTARVHLALDARPVFRGLSDDALDGAILITSDLNGIERAYDDAKYGRVSSEPLLKLRMPSIADASLAPPGHHVMSISVQYAPYRLREGTWDAARRDALGGQVLSRLEAVAPGLRNLVLHHEVLTPADLANRYGLPEGSTEHGEIALDQALFMRPVPDCARYRTPIRGLYLCGDDMHPGRVVAGGAGRLTAREVMRDGGMPGASRR